MLLHLIMEVIHQGQVFQTPKERKKERKVSLKDEKKR